MATHNGEPGMAKIKEEFILLDYKPKLDTEYVSKTVKKQLDEDQSNDKESNEPPAKKMKLKGRNKKRPKGKKMDAADKLCTAIIHERACSYGDKCKFNHDKSLFMEKKPADIGDTCYLFDTYGKCDYGITCRFAKCHLNEALDNMKKEDFTSKKNRFDRFTNVMKKDLQVSLWKRKYDFSRANKMLDKLFPGANKFCKEKDKSAEMKRNKANAGIDPNKDAKETHSQSNQTNAKDVEAAASSTSAENRELNSTKQTDSDIIKQSAESDKDPKSGADSGNATTEITNSTGDSVKDTVKDTVDGNVEMKVVEDVNKEKETCNSNGVSAVSVNGDIKKSVNGKGDIGKDGLGVKDSDRSGVVQLNEEGVIKLRPQEKKIINFSNKLYLAPLTTVGNLPFRRICKEYGADITCGEMAVSTNLLQGQASEWALLKRHESEDLFGVQLCGAYPDSMSRCAQLITETMDVDFLDINCGCPIDLIFNKGEGSALMGRLNKFEQIVKGMQAVIDVPLTVKIRTGIYNDKNTAHTLVPHLRDWGCSLTTIHGRSRVQRYTKLADWDYISECAEAAKPMPLYGNGDILSFEDANERREKTGVSGLMIARGALIKPWIFKEIKDQKHWDISSHERFEMLKRYTNYGLDHWGSDHQGVENTRRFLLEWLSFLYRGALIKPWIFKEIKDQKHWDISSHERFEMLKRYTNYGLDHWGSDHQGVENTRRFLLEWLSFLYRYIPVGVLDRVPQQINERPPYYKGRDDLETLMASPNCGDWIKISEMLLGPVPDDFIFLPKHKANAYK